MVFAKVVMTWANYYKKFTSTSAEDKILFSNSLRYLITLGVVGLVLLTE